MQFPKPQKEAKTETVPHFHCPKLSEKYDLLKTVLYDEEVTDQIYWQCNITNLLVTQGIL